MAVRCIFCFLLIILLIFSIISAGNIFPLQKNELVAEKYSGWSGVIRIWLVEGWKPGAGSFNGWLNNCTGRFEKMHDGVYVQIQTVNASAAGTLFENGIIPPDMMIFPPNVLDSPTHLIPLDRNNTLRHPFMDSGLYGGVLYAMPIAAGGYAWAYNTSLIERIPNTWKDHGFAISAFPDDEKLFWSAGLMGLCSGRYLSEPSEVKELDIARDLDLGLSIIEATPAPTATAEPSDADFLYCALPDGFSSDLDAYSDFITGKIAAIPVTQYHIRRLAALSDTGKGPDWNIETTGDIPFTDQLLFAAVVDRNEDVEKQTLCREFIDHLLSDDCQKELNRAGAFSVTEAYSDYKAHDPLVLINDVLRTDRLCTISAFDRRENTSVNDIVREFFKNNEFTPDLFDEYLLQTQ